MCAAAPPPVFPWLAGVAGEVRALELEASSSLEFGSGWDGSWLSARATADDGALPGSCGQLCGFQASSCMGLAAGNDNSMRSQALQQALHDVAFITNNAVEQYVAVLCATARGEIDERAGRGGEGGGERKEEEKGEAPRAQRLRSCARGATWCRAAGMCARTVHGVILCAWRVVGGRS